MTTDLHDQLTSYLNDAHSIEEQALAQLRSAPDIAGDEELAENYREHLRETEGHESEVRRLLAARDAGPSRAKDTVMAVGGKGFVLFARLQPDTPGKLHAHALSYEALELSSYELLRGVAEAAEELEVVEAADRIAAEEREMIERLESTFDRAVETIWGNSCASTSPTPTRSRRRRRCCSSGGRSWPAIRSSPRSMRGTSTRRTGMRS